MTDKTQTILVLEDERPLVEAIRIKLEKNGFAVVTARSAEQALGYLADAMHVDAIWLDHYLMGKETGLDFLTAVKKDPKTKAIPVFVVTNSGAPDKRQAYLSLGAVSYFVKSDQRLGEIVNQIILQSNQQNTQT